MVRLALRVHARNALRFPPGAWGVYSRTLIERRSKGVGNLR